jgi:anti-sigma factor RsiW
MQIFTKAKHVSDDALGLHALNDLPESDRQPVTDHLSQCPYCRQRFAEVKEFVSFLRLAAASQTMSRPYVIH